MTVSPQPELFLQRGKLSGQTLNKRMLSATKTLELPSCTDLEILESLIGNSCLQRHAQRWERERILESKNGRPALCPAV